MLVNGEILEMPAAGGPHDVALTLLDDLIRRAFPTGFAVRCQMSLVLGRSIDPVPDLAVVSGSARDFIHKPTTAALVVEISDSSLDYNVGDKACLYASAGIADYSGSRPGESPPHRFSRSARRCVQAVRLRVPPDGDASVGTKRFAPRRSRSGDRRCRFDALMNGGRSLRRFAAFILIRIE